MLVINSSFLPDCWLVLAFVCLRCYDPSTFGFSRKQIQNIRSVRNIIFQGRCHTHLIHVHQFISIIQLRDDCVASSSKDQYYVAHAYRSACFANLRATIDILSTHIVLLASTLSLRPTAYRTI
jgi:hypothetical protein